MSHPELLILPFETFKWLKYVISKSNVNKLNIRINWDENFTENLTEWLDPFP